MLCFRTNISQPFKLSSSSIVEEEVAILSFKSVVGGEKQGGPYKREGNLSREGQKTKVAWGKCRNSDKKNRKGAEHQYTV